MILYRRKMMAQQIEDCKGTTHLPSLDWLEAELLDAMSEDSADVAVGRLTVLSAQLLETARRADPAYGLQSIQIGAVDPADRGEFA